MTQGHSSSAICVSTASALYAPTMTPAMQVNVRQVASLMTQAVLVCACVMMEVVDPQVLTAYARHAMEIVNLVTRAG